MEWNCHYKSIKKHGITETNGKICPASTCSNVFSVFTKKSKINQFEKQQTMKKNITTTMFERVDSKNYADCGLFASLVTNKYQTIIEELRAAKPHLPPSEFRDRKRKLLPAIAVGGRYAGGHEAGNLVEPSNCIALDFDNLPDLDQAKTVISNQPFVAYCGLSCSGTGLFAIVEVADGKQHTAHWKALERHFDNLGLVVDGSTKNPNRLRYVSYDSSPYLNRYAEVYRDVVSEPIYTPPTYRKSNTDDVSTLLDHVINAGVDITSGRTNWLKIGSAIAGAYGASGEDSFVAISAFNPTFKESEARKTYQQSCARHPKDKGVLFNIASTYGIRIK